ncbi:MAG: hypothetical protein BGO55_21765 [Sphingobacteriales bacterium 50-39]|nr:MAG: hypothetical protein BGO55_21765 [Sphingobacteriales bacterium 50-39]
MPFCLFSQTLPVRFEQVGINEGLSQSTVTCILQDRKGFIWFGTKDGLNKYDGYRFTVFKKNFKNENCLSSNDIKSMVEDRDGKIWIATSEGGVNKLDPVTGRFVHYYKGASVNGISSDHTRCIYEDREGNIWLGTEGEGVDVCDKKTGRFRHFVYDDKVVYEDKARQSGINGDDISDNTINALYQDSKGNIWIGTAKKGLYLFNPVTNELHGFLNDAADKRSLSNNNVQFIYEDKQKRLWVGTYGGGLDLYDPAIRGFLSFPGSQGSAGNGGGNRLLSVAEDDKGMLWIGTENGGVEVFDPVTQRAMTYVHQDADNTSLSGNTINAVYSDTKGNIWLGVLNGGINMVNKDAARFAHYKYTPGNNIINCLYEDGMGKLWIGTDGGGLRRFDRTSKQVFAYRHVKNDPRSISGDYVLSVCEDAAHQLWVGTWGDGISVMDPRTGVCRQFRYTPGDAHSLSNNNAFVLLRDRRNKIWIGTYGGGLNLYDPSKGGFVHFLHDPSDPASLSSNYILTLQEDRQGHLWVGTDGGGLDRLDPESHTFHTYRRGDAKNSLSSNSVRTMWQDQQGYLWLGTNFGLDRFDPSTGATVAYFEQNGLPDDWVTGILGDARGTLWISTTKGLSRFNAETGSFKNFTMSDGIQGYEFKSACLCRDGQMYFGGKNGFNEFYPDSIRSTNFDPPIVFTDFQLFNKEVEVAQNDKDPSPLKVNIADADQIVLTHDQSVISFGFASLNYTGREKKAYAYMLENFDKGWHDLGPKNSVTYTNIDPGDYVLRVRGLTNDGQRSTRQASIRLRFLPPYWKTWWFRSMVVVLISGITLLIFYRRVAAIKNRNRLLERQVAVRTKELQEANHTKDRFFSILAHDLKNPVSALAGISDMLKKQLPELSEEAVYDHVDTIHKAAGSVSNLLNNLLDWARTQTQHISCTPAGVSAYELVRKNQLLAEPQLNDKHIGFSMDVATEHVLWVDPRMMDTVLRNIISNSIKFTPAHGKITVVSEDLGNEISITVSDTGIGMTREQIEMLYAIKKQRPMDGTAGEKGTGLGLIISREFMEINKGSIVIQSEPGKGSSFRMLCPKAADTGLTFVLPDDLLGGAPDIASSPASADMDSLSAAKISDLKGRKVLVVDDNEEIRNYLKLMLSGNFGIVEAANGQEGIEAAREHQPDVIISDMLMPVMNGLEFCKKIKGDKATSHIPVIILTSQTSQESHLSGYEAGADVYLMKDISRHILFQVILNFLRNQEKLRERFARSGDIYPEGLDFNKLDKEFLDDVSRFVEAHLSDVDLDYKKICSHTAMSRTVLYAKFKTLTGQGVHDFVKTVRVKKGLQLLQEGRLNITQIAYEVGFSTPSYFSKSFTKQFGLPPKEYLAELKKKAVQDL